MKDSRKIYTLRPYYIDCERLYDVYSTIMDGYSETQEVVEIIKSNIQRGKNFSSTSEFSVTSLLSGGINMALSGGWHHASGNERELQVKTTRRLPPSVLLNWLLDKMEKDDQIVRMPRRWWHITPFSQKEDGLGKPVILSGNIKTNSLKTLQKLEIYPKGIKGIIRRISDYFARETHTRLSGKKYILSPIQDHNVYRAFQDIRLIFEDFDDSVSNIQSSGNNEIDVALNEVFAEYSKIRYLITKWIEDFRNLSASDDELEVIAEKIKQLKFKLEKTDYPSKDTYLYRVIFTFSCDLGLLYRAISEYQQIRRKQKESPAVVDRYIFNLKNQMYYYANATDILNASQINCFALIKNVGMHIHEIEVIALYL